MNGQIDIAVKCLYIAHTKITNYPNGMVTIDSSSQRLQTTQYILDYTQ